MRASSDKLVPLLLLVMTMQIVAAVFAVVAWVSGEAWPVFGWLLFSSLSIAFASGIDEACGFTTRSPK
jgi:hypothetical protein